MDLSIIVINYRTPDLSIACVKSIKESLKNSAYKYEIVLIDNCSKDGSLEKLKCLECDNVYVYETKKNGGFAYGNNFGVARSSGDYVFFLNSDTVLYPNVLEEMLSYMKENSSCGALTCCMEDGKNEPLVVTHKFESLKTLFLQTIVKPLTPKFIRKKRAEIYQNKNTSEIVICDWLCGAALLMPRKVFDQVGGWDETFFMYMEDEELCLRIHNAGYQVSLFPKIGLQHLVGKSGGSAFVAYEQYRSKIIYFRDVCKKYNKFMEKLLFIQAKAYMKKLPKKERKEVLKKLKEV